MRISDEVTLIAGEVTDVTENEVASESLDLIIGDPIYLVATQNATDIARFADRTLKPSGTLVLPARLIDSHKLSWIVGRAAKNLNFAYTLWIPSPLSDNSSFEKDCTFWLVFRKEQPGVPANEYFSDVDAFLEEEKNRAGEYHDKFGPISDYFITRKTGEKEVVCEIGVYGSSIGDFARRRGRAFVMICTPDQLEEFRKHFEDLERKGSYSKSAAA